MSSEETKCNLCGRPADYLLSKIKDYFIFKGKSMDFSVIYCNNCKLGFSRPELSSQQLLEYYPADYESFVPKNKLFSLLLKVKYSKDLKIIRRLLNAVSTQDIFEIGAGRGEFIFFLRQKGLTVSGIEPGQSGVNYAKDFFKLEVENSSAENYNFSKKYDVIVLRHVLEHIKQFKRVLKKIKEDGLKDSGFLFLKVPRMDSAEARLFGKFWHGYDLPRHQVHFTKIGLTKILSDFGYKQIEIKQEMVPFDTIRSIEYYSRYSESGFLKNLAVIFTALPQVLKVILGQAIVLILRFKGAGRMIITARN